MSLETVQVSSGPHLFEMGVQTRYWLDSVLYRNGTWEAEDVRYALSLVRPGAQAVDVGAHAGFHTLWLALAVGPEGRVLAIEPASESCARLRDNVRHNRLNNVRIVRAVAAEALGTRTLHLSAVDIGSSSCVTLPPPHEDGGTEQVPAATLDQMIEAAGMAPDFVKIDVEGMEMQVLRGAGRLLAARRAALMIEVNALALRAAGVAAAELVGKLHAAGYELRTADGTRVSAPNLPEHGWVNVFALPAQA